MIELVPAIDIMDGRCVRLVQGDFTRQTEYSRDPAAVAQGFESAGFKRLHLVDLDGARAGSPRNIPVLEKISSAASLVIDFSGGLRSRTDLQTVFEAGAKMAAIGSVAVRSPELFFEWLAEFGADRLILAADSKQGKAAAAGWTESSELPLTDFLAPFAAKGLRQVLCTDISRDGLLAGPSFELYADLITRFPEFRLLASGGVSSVNDINKLAAIGVHGVIIGKALYEGRISPKELEPFLC
jgi:phosphoribosylformimino-5-aminoimidazole carboxamide ribotide isomerase